MIPVRFPVILGFIHPVSPLRAGLHGFWGARLRYNSLEWNNHFPASALHPTGQLVQSLQAIYPRRYALPCTPKTAHSNPSNCGFQDNTSPMFP